MEAVSSTGDARLVLIGAILTALITAAGPILLALVNRGHRTDSPPAPDLDLVDDLDSINDRLVREIERKDHEIERLARTVERKDMEIERLHEQVGMERNKYARDATGERHPPHAPLDPGN